jgi:hypothetical protein
MGTKELGWSAARFSAVRFLALSLSVSTVALALTAHTAYADQKKSRDKIVEFNKQALLSYEAKDFDTARDLLTKALKEAKQAGLEDDKMTARTYLHLGAVYWVGFQDQSVALQNFALAKKIRPDIQLTPSIETADLKSVFDLAVAEPDAPPAARQTTPARPAAQSRPVDLSSRLSDDGGEPDLPTSMSAPLMCTVPSEVPPGKELSMRCALKPGIPARVVQLHYRAPGVEAYQLLGMRKTAKGWYLVTVPASVMKTGTLQVYFDARDAGDNEVASNGQIDSPSGIEVRSKKEPGNAAGGECPVDDPMCKIRRGAAADQYEAGLHRRREGAFWIGLGGGAGWGYMPAGKLEWEKYIQVSAVSTTTGQFHLIVPELGYMVSDTFGLAVRLRYEYFQQQQSAQGGPDGAPTTQALAGFGRAIWYSDLSSDGNFQISYSADVGGGFIRLPVKPVVVNMNVNGDSVPDPSKTIYKTDTRAMGPVLLGGSGGFIYHISRHFALALEGRAVIGLPGAGFALEGDFTAHLAFGGTKGPAPTEEEGEGESGSGGPINDAPPPAESPAEDEKEE